MTVPVHPDANAIIRLADDRDPALLRFPRRLNRIRASFGGKAPEAIQVASASLAGCRLIVASDKRLRTPPEIRRVGVEDLDELVDLS
ncbi:hypothetical protein GCM10011390_31020 [Aureimonas endophytica]|uniref:Uncharacterized protein n=1 Tax=Aureimonas endophytica TaxID=2027858 RepID=A0A916ZRV2_9HYPH|nr:hypothetical protein GCM10011390_31020 [Aureimonas endophytica]